MSLDFSPVTAFFNGIWSALKATLVALWDTALKPFFGIVIATWKVTFGILLTIAVMLKESVEMVLQLVYGFVAAVSSLVGGVGPLSQGGALANSPWANALSFINAFIPLTEILAGASVFFALMGVALGISFTRFCVDRIKWWIFNWV